MTNIKLKRGYHINLQGEAEKRIFNIPLPEKIAIKPTDFKGIKPKLNVDEQPRVHKLFRLIVKAYDRLNISNI